MKLIDGVEPLRRWREGLGEEVRVGVVPTMGFLHEGHLSLLRIARERVGPSGQVMLTIFVNPTQFAVGEDLDRYPTDREGDLEKARAAGADVVFAPSNIEELYPLGEGAWVDISALSGGLCGRSRPTHFRGVATVVMKLWGLIRPNVGVFGEKDAQQLAVIRRMHAEFFLGGEVVGGPIVREPDGLAMSSRNAYLTVQNRREALRIPALMTTVQERFAAGERGVAALLEGGAAAIVPGRLDYLEIVDAQTLEPVREVTGPCVCAIAAHFGKSRLLDNCSLTP